MYIHVLKYIHVSNYHDSAGFSGMDESTALFILHKIVHDFITIVTEQAKVLPDTDSGKCCGCLVIR